MLYALTMMTRKWKKMIQSILVLAIQEMNPKKKTNMKVEENRIIGYLHFFI
jgi:hypothetical protein